MPGEDIAELVVQVTPEGVQDTTEQLRDQSQAFTDMADEAEEQTGKFQRFSRKWKGAMQVFAGGLAVATAGMASQVPVLGEAFAGVKAVITSLALLMDEVLRPVIGPINQGLFELANAISNTEGPTRALIGIAGTLATVLGAIAGVAATVGGLMGGVSGAVSAVASAFSGLVGIATTIVGILGGPLTLAIIGIAAAIAGLALAWENNWLNIRTITKDAISKIKSFIDAMVAKAESAAESIRSFLDSAIQAFIDKVNEAVRLANTLPGVSIDPIGGGTGGALPGGGDIPPGGGVGGRPTPGGGGGGGGDSPFFSPGQPGIVADLDVNLDSKTIASETKEFQVRGALSRGRGTLPGE